MGSYLIFGGLEIDQHMSLASPELTPPEDSKSGNGAQAVH